jgi:6-phosphogluconolactonase
MRRISLLALTLLALFAPSPVQAQEAETLVYVGTFSGRGSQGIYGWRLDPSTARMEPLGLVVETSNPGFLALHPNQRILYATGDSAVAEDQRIGVVRSFAVDVASGLLAPINAVSSRGENPAYVSVDRSGRNVLVANYSGGTVAVLPTSPDGRLAEASDTAWHSGSSVHPRRQTRAYPHSFDVSPDNRFALAADLGADRMFVYRLDAAQGTLTTNTPATTPLHPGAGPRHFTFDPAGRNLYVANELTSSVTLFRWDADAGTLTEVETVSTLPAGYDAESTVSEVRMHPTGSYLYVANRGHDSLVRFSVDPAGGRLGAPEWTSAGGRTPRNFAIDPSGRILISANQNSDAIVVFRIDPASGRLVETGQRLAVPTPSYVLFRPTP